MGARSRLMLIVRRSLLTATSSSINWIHFPQIGISDVLELHFNVASSTTRIPTLAIAMKTSKVISSNFQLFLLNANVSKLYPFVSR